MPCCASCISNDKNTPRSLLETRSREYLQQGQESLEKKEELDATVAAATAPVPVFETDGSGKVIDEFRAVPLRARVAADERSQNWQSVLDQPPRPTWRGREPRRVTDSVGDVLGVRRGEPTGSKESGATGPSPGTPPSPRLKTTTGGLPRDGPGTPIEVNASLHLTPNPNSSPDT